MALTLAWLLGEAGPTTNAGFEAPPPTFAAPLPAAPVPTAGFAPREPAAGGELEPEPDTLPAELAPEEEPAEQDDEPTVPSPEGDPPATPSPVAGEVPVPVLPEAQPAAPLEVGVEGDDVEGDDVDGAGGVEGAVDVDGAVVDAGDPGLDEPSDGATVASDGWPPGAAAEGVDEPVPALPDWPEVPVTVVEPGAAGFEDAPLAAPDAPPFIADADTLVSELEPTVAVAAWADEVAMPIARVTVTIERQRVPYMQPAIPTLGAPLPNLLPFRLTFWVVSRGCNLFSTTRLGSSTNGCTPFDYPFGRLPGGFIRYLSAELKRITALIV